ncbi:MAG: Gx transporter family protein, partial [Lachnospiraceae bacterium]|nr:Gx transporter family protein [Lachnospiraceae bacterium]
MRRRRNKSNNNNASHIAQKVAVIGALAAFGAILSYIETLIGFSLGVPGVKLGIANIAVLVTLYRYNARSAAAVNLVRILVVGLLFGNLFSIAFSIFGAFISLIVMIIVKKTDKFSILGTSAVGGVGHNMGQALAAMFIVDSYSVVYYIPVLFVAGIVTGIAVGLVSNIIL